MPSTSKIKTIAYYGGVWPTNVGNAFIDFGAMAILRAALPDARIDFYSESPRWFFGRGLQPLPTPPSSLQKRVARRITRTPPPRAPVESDAQVRANMDCALDMAALAVADLAVFSGMAMCQEFIDINGPTILKLRARGVPVLLLGTGGELYTPAEKKAFKQFLKEVQPIGFISRDRPSLEMFAGDVNRSWEGIDCGFFTPEYFSAPKIDHEPYIAVSFDMIPEAKISPGGLAVLRAHHDCWGPISRQWLAPKTMISDLPQDFLTLYANAKIVYSDRVHACVAGLAYGNRAQLFSATPRGALFEAVGAAGVRHGPVRLDPADFAAKKKAQIETVRKWLT